MYALHDIYLEIDYATTAIHYLNEMVSKYGNDKVVNNLRRGESFFSGNAKVIQLFETLKIRNEINDIAFNQFKEFFIHYQACPFEAWESEGTFGELCVYLVDDLNEKVREKGLKFIVKSASDDNVASLALHQLGRLYLERNNIEQAVNVYKKNRTKYPFAYISELGDEIYFTYTGLYELLRHFIKTANQKQFEYYKSYTISYLNELEGYCKSKNRSQKASVIRMVNRVNDLKFPKTHLSVKSNVLGANILIDGKTVGQTNLAGMSISAGEYRVSVQKESYETKSMWVSLDAGEDKSLDIQLKQATTAGGQQGQTWIDPVTSMEFVWVPGGCFQMGLNPVHSDEMPVHEVCLDGYWIGKFEVTQGQWKIIMGSNPSKFSNCGDNCPVERVSWKDAKAFIRKLNSRSNGVTFSLLSEAQWEYAARSGGKNEKYSGGNDIEKVGWYGSNSGNKTHRVGTKSPNGLGIYDMSGNVREWCEDTYSKSAYSQHSRNNPIYTGSGSERVLRGGCWGIGAGYCRATDRDRWPASLGFDHMGFRVLRK